MPLKTGYEDYGLGEMSKAVTAGVNQIGTIFKDRFDRKQYDDFLAGPSKDYQNKLQQAQDLMLDETNPDSAQQAVHIMKNATTDFMDNATRFKSNPYIMQKAQMVWQGHLNSIKEEFTAKHETALAERAKQSGRQEAEMFPLKKAGVEAKTALALAQAGQANRSPVDKNKNVGVISYLSGDPAVLGQIADPDQRADVARSNVLRTINSPKDEVQRKQIQSGIGNEAKAIASQQVAELQSRGENRPVQTNAAGITSGGDSWDAGNPIHVADAMKLVDPSVAKEQFVMHTLQGEGSQVGLDPNVVEGKFGVLVDPAKATPQHPVTRTLKDDEIVQVLFGHDGLTRMKVNSDQPVLDRNGKPAVDKNGNVLMKPRSVRNIKEAIVALPDDPKDIQGPMSDALGIAQKELKQQLVDGQTVTEPEVEEAIRHAGLGIVSSLIGVGDKTSDLPQGLRNNRNTGHTMARAIAKKYAHQIAINIGVVKETPAPEATTKKEKPSSSSSFLKDYTPLGTAGDLLNSTGLTGVINKIRGK